MVNFNVNGPAAQALGTLTTRMVTDYYPSATTNANNATLNLLAVVLDGNLQGSPPQVTGAISTQGQINGGSAGFSQSQATQLADVLKYGSLPLSFKRPDSSRQSQRSSAPAQLSAGLLAASSACCSWCCTRSCTTAAWASCRCPAWSSRQL